MLLQKVFDTKLQPLKKSGSGINGFWSFWIISNSDPFSILCQVSDSREQAHSRHGCKVQKVAVTLLIARFSSLRLLFFKVKGSEYHKLCLQAIFILKRQKNAACFCMNFKLVKYEYKLQIHTIFN